MGRRERLPGARPRDDREDIFSLSRAIDDVLDYCTTTVYEFEIYELKSDARILGMSLRQDVGPPTR